MASHLRRIVGAAALVRTRTGKPILAQLAEIARLRRADGSIGAEDYYELDLFEDDLGFAEKTSFVGWRRSAEIDRALNQDAVRILANDKIINYQLLTALGFPVAPTLATFSTTGRRIASEQVLRSTDEVFTFLASGSGFPIFAKPARGTYGRGTYAISNYIAEERAVELTRAKTISESDFVGQLLFKPFGGYLFQKVVVPHARIVDVAGPTVSCVRLGVVTEPEPRVHFAFWKISVGDSVTDNFSRGASGNFVAAIDLASGRLGDIVARPGPFRTRVTEHPTTGRALTGFQIPMWREVVDLCLSVAPHFPGLRLQNWDVVVTDDGPLLLELNTEADLYVVNLVERRGVLRDGLPELVAAHRR